MHLNRYNSLEEFKKKYKIHDDNAQELAQIYNDLYSEYHENEYERKKFSTENLENLLEISKNLNPKNIPYSEITNIIFRGMLGYSSTQEVSFSEQLQYEMESFIRLAFTLSTEKPNVDETPDTNNSKKNDDVYLENTEYSSPLGIDSSSENGLEVFYKLIQHTELAIAQKHSLYAQQSEDIDQLVTDVRETSDKYNNMISNFISILGIFAAIMVATFGGIQGFTALFTNESHHSLTEIFLISTFGVFALISIIFLLFYSISKLVNKDLTNYDYNSSYNFFSKYPIYSHTIFITLIIFLLSLTHHFKTNEPSYLPIFIINHMWSFTIFLLFILLLVYFIYIYFKENHGSQYIREYIIDKLLMNVKDKIGLQWFVIFVFIMPIVLIF